MEEEVGAEGANEAEKEDEEGMKVLRSRKMAEGLAFVSLRGQIELVSYLSPLGFGTSGTHPPISCQPFPLRQNERESVHACRQFFSLRLTACPGGSCSRILRERAPVPSGRR